MPFIELHPDLAESLYSIFSTPISEANPDVTWGALIAFIILLYVASKILGGKKK